MPCPACGSLKHRQTTIRNIRVESCSKCGAIYGTVYLGDSYAIVSPFLQKDDGSEIRYFDLTTLGSEGVGRRHGWFVPETGRLVQVG